MGTGTPLLTLIASTMDRNIAPFLPVTQMTTMAGTGGSRQLPSEMLSTITFAPVENRTEKKQRTIKPKINYRVEIYTSAWRDEPQNSEVLHVKEKRPFGATRGNTSVPQVPELVIRIPAKLGGEDPKRSKSIGIRAELWDYGQAGSGTKVPPSKGVRFDHLKNGLEISCSNNIAVFGPPQDDGYRYAVLKCAISRAARIPCKRQHIALRLDCVRTKSINGELQVSAVVAGVQPVRSRRISISEKAMCPRACDIRKKQGSRQRSQSQFEAQQYFNPSSIDLAGITRQFHSGSFSSVGTVRRDSDHADLTQAVQLLQDAQQNSKMAQQQIQQQATPNQAYMSYYNLANQQHQQTVKAGAANQPTNTLAFKNEYSPIQQQQQRLGMVRKQSDEEAGFYSNALTSYSQQDQQQPAEPLQQQPPLRKKRSFDEVVYGSTLSPCLTPLLSAHGQMSNKMLKAMPQLSLATGSVGSTAPSSPTLGAKQVSAEWLQNATGSNQSMANLQTRGTSVLTHRNSSGGYSDSYTDSPVNKASNVLNTSFPSSNYGPLFLFNSVLNQAPFST